MSNVVTSIATSLAVDNLWGVVGDIVPILTIGILFGLGFWLVKKIINRFRKGKGGM